jgi:hypothetical protein
MLYLTAIIPLMGKKPVISEKLKLGFRSVQHSAQMYHIVRGSVKLQLTFALSNLHEELQQRNFPFLHSNAGIQRVVLLVRLDSLLLVRISLSSGLSHAKKIYGQH